MTKPQTNNNGAAPAKEKAQSEPPEMVVMPNDKFTLVFSATQLELLKGSLNATVQQMGINGGNYIDLFRNILKQMDDQFEEVVKAREKGGKQ